MTSTNAFRPDAPSLRGLLARNPGLRLDAPGASLSGADLLASTVFAGWRGEFAGKSILIGARAQLASARALIELDGLAARLVICPPDFSAERLASVASQAEIDVIVCDSADRDFGGGRQVVRCGEPVPQTDEPPRRASQWVLPTSGTTGAPKLVAHGLEGLLGAIGAATPQEPAPVWATFYDIRRYGGLQIFLRACARGARLVLSDADESLSDFLARCRAAGVTHMSGTPSHWRRLLMSPHVHMVYPKYVRLSGEIADRAILDALRAAYPKARVVHAYASTEAGVGFEVTDGREGFPASLLEAPGEVELRLRDGALHIRSPRTALGYIGRDDLRLFDEEGFVDTGDMVEQAGERCFFKGRRAGTINVGGLKVHPEEVERIINMHDGVRMSRVFARRNPIVGDLIVAEIVLTDEGAAREAGAVLQEVLGACRAELARHMVPATIRVVPALDVLASGKLARAHA